MLRAPTSFKQNLVKQINIETLKSRNNFQISFHETFITNNIKQTNKLLHVETRELLQGNEVVTKP